MRKVLCSSQYEAIDNICDHGNIRAGVVYIYMAFPLATSHYIIHKSNVLDCLTSVQACYSKEQRISTSQIYHYHIRLAEDDISLYP